jgi:membrane-associated phospholipid phosphatase
MKLNTENIVSVLPLIFIMTPCFKLIYLTAFNKFINTQLIYIGGIIFTTISIQMFKQIPYPSSYYKYTMRPQGASGCDYYSAKGLVPDNSPGMPSGHMGTTAFFIIYNYLYLNNNYKNLTHYKPLIIIVFSGLITIMGWARYKKKCHNIYQIIIGSIYGGIMGYLFYLI